MQIKFNFLTIAEFGFNDSLDIVKRRQHMYESESCMTDYDILNDCKQIFLFQSEPLRLGSFLAVPEFSGFYGML